MHQSDIKTFSDVKTNLSSKAVHIYLAFENTNIENSTIFIQRIYEFIDNIISNRLDMRINTECTIQHRLSKHSIMLSIRLSTISNSLYTKECNAFSWFRNSLAIRKYDNDH